MVYAQTSRGTTLAPDSHYSSDRTHPTLQMRLDAALTEAQRRQAFAAAEREYTQRDGGPSFRALPAGTQRALAIKHARQMANLSPTVGGVPVSASSVQAQGSSSSGGSTFLHRAADAAQRAGLQTTPMGSNVGLGGGGGGGGVGGVGGPQAPARNWRAEVAALFPFLPSAAIAIVARTWERTGDINVGIAEMRQDRRYDTEWFPGNRRDDGSIRLSEQEYLSWIEGYQMDFALYGLNPSVFRGRFAELVEHGVHPEVLARRLQAVHSEVAQNIDQVRQVYASYYGRNDLTNEAVFAMAIDPQVSENVLNRRITAAQIGGTAATFGFARSAGRAEHLAAGGLDQEAARRLFSGAAEHLPRLQAFAQRFHDPLGQDFTLGQFEEAGVFADQQQMGRMRRLSQSERASFSPFGQIAEDREGAARGLRPR